MTRRLLPVLLLAGALTACTPTAAATPATPAAGPAPVTGGLRQVHTPAVLVDDMHLRAGQCHARGATAATTRPDPACTPGAVDPAVTPATLAATICRPGWTATIRPPASVTSPAKTRAMAAYGVTGAGGYEYDHLVPLELGGASTTSNLWPELGGTPNPKDRVENTLHTAVCAGRLTLARAQQEIAADWTTAR